MENSLNCIIKQVTVKDAQSSYFNQKVDIQITDGIISKIAKEIDSNSDYENIEFDKPVDIWPGLCDFRVHFRDPGEEVKENLESGLSAALAGGITTVGILPSTQPSISSKSIVEYVKQKSLDHPVEVAPFGTVSSELKGENLAELYDMWMAGAMVFTDDLQTLTPSILLRGLQYVQNFNGLIVQFPTDLSMFKGGQVHEGVTSTQNGLKGIPNIAEYTVVARDLEILEYTGGRIHFSGISTHQSVTLIAQAKARGLDVTADVSVANLLYTESALSDFDTAYKLMPPLRSEKDRLALIEGIKNGTIDVVCSDHRPEDQEAKFLEFEHASYGRIGTQTLFLELNSIGLTDECINSVLIQNPRKLLKSSCPNIKEQQPFNAMFYSKSDETVVDENTQFSQSCNTSIWKQTLKGAIIGVGVENKLYDF